MRATGLGLPERHCRDFFIDVMEILRHRVSSLRSVNPRIVVALFLVGVFALGAVVLAAGGNEDEEGSPNTFEGSLMPEGVRAPDFRLQNQDGETVTMSS